MVKKKSMTPNIITKESGITLISLIVTIIIMLILAGVTISMVAGENGLIAKAREEREQYLNVQDKKQDEVNVLEERVESRQTNTEVANDAQPIKYQADLNGQKFETFDDALVALKSSTSSTNKITLMKDLNDTKTGMYQFTKSVTIDLNGHDLETSRYFLVYARKVTITGKGTIKTSDNMPFNLMGSSNPAATNGYTTLNIDKDVNLYMDREGWGYMITMAMTNYLNYKYGIVVNFNGTMSGSENTKLIGFFINGLYEDTKATINIQDNAVINAMYGVICSGDATFNFSGKINATRNGIEMRSGTLNITKGSIISTYPQTTVLANGSGSTTDGAAIAIAQHTTLKPIKVNISGGEFKAYTPFLEANPQNNAKEATDLIELNITGGKYQNLENSTAKSITSQDCENFIKGGTFDVSPDQNYLVEGYKIRNINGKYNVVSE